MLMKTLPLYLQDDSHPQALVCQTCEVRRSALFGALDAASLERIHAHIAAPSLLPGARIYGLGESASAVYTVRAGIVRFERVTASGDRRIVRLAGRGDLIGQEALLQQPYADDAVACTPVQLCRIPTSLVDELGRQQSALLLELMRRWQQALEQAECWVTELATGAARHRVLRLLALLQRHAHEPDLIWLPRRDEMGAMLSMTVETASRVVSQLRREGVLELLPPLHARLDAAALVRARLHEQV
jgi:CRP/FNR family transcriptional regulator, anaerobic regulatory protein